MQTSSTWSSMVSGPEDDFSSFLEFGDLQLTFPPFDGNNHGGEGVQDATNGPHQMEMQTSNNAAGPIDFQHSNMPPFTDSSALTDYENPSAVFPELSMDSQLFEQQQQQQLQHQMPQPLPYGQPYRGQNMIPHTPNSIEMHGGQPQYQQVPSSNHAHAMYDHYRQQSKGQAAFTPLVSPAVTPHDAQFRYQDYAVPSQYFSPLTSPALEAQRSVYSALRGSDTSDTTSPVDMNIDPSLQSSAPATTRKARRKPSNAAQRPPSRSVRQSPSMKPQSRKKHSSNTSIPGNKISGIAEDAENARRSFQANQHAIGRQPGTISLESSEAESISPEPLSEILMPPPATPKSASASKSPQLAAKPVSQPTPVAPMSDKPATPASLMKIRKGAGRSAGSALKEQSFLVESELEQTMEAITLPDAAKGSAKRPALTPLRTSDANEDEVTPTMSARKTPKIAPTSAPVTAASSVFPSPSSIASPNTSTSSKRGDPRLGGPGGKKRTNSSSVQVSPALRPRISPSIKPLLPEGAAVSAETSALFLASKSNYQNLLEGTHLPGVSYPEALSTNLTSKRTSHKLAEQGRRNRINTALQEIASLLPTAPNGATPKDAIGNPNLNGKMESPGANVMMTGTAAQQSNSKATTVELAISYIKELQGELRDVKMKLEFAEKKLADSSCDDGHTDGAKEVTTGGGKEGNDDG